MKIVKLSLIIVAAAAVMFGLSSVSFAFHSGGVAECTGCHEMHGAKDTATGYLLVGTDQSSTCLSCHGKSPNGTSGGSSYHIYDPDAGLAGTGIAPGNMTPGGDFAWLKKTYVYTGYEGVATNDGDSHGHNIIAVDFGLTQDKTNSTAPGGTMSSANLHCNSCHDQHGQTRLLNNGTFATTGGAIVGSGSYATSTWPASGSAVGTYRLLRSSVSDNTHAGGQTLSFGNSPVVAWAPKSYNKTEALTQTRVEYNNSVSDYCGSCHPDMHSTAGILRHPQGQAINGLSSNYNSYVMTGNMTGSSATSYLSLVPYEDNAALSQANWDAGRAKAVADNSVTTGPNASSLVMCLSCHRAHATGFEEMTRWDNETEFIVKGGSYPAIDGKTSFEELAAYYNRPASQFATYQRSLCNKCHAKD